MYNSEYKARNQSTTATASYPSISSTHKMELENHERLKKDKMVFPKEKCTIAFFN
jgi:hypothetical protein